MKSLILSCKSIISYIKEKKWKENYSPLYKLIEIVEAEEEYRVVIKVINKNIIFQAKPEEILANDFLVDQFSPRDIRALTYLGYLGVNSPTYKILAKKLSRENDKIIFSLKKKGEKTMITKTAEQILTEKDMILHMSPEDAKTVGYTIGSESILKEKTQKEKLHTEFQNSN